MKKIMNIFAGCILGAALTAQAGLITITPPSIDLWDLDHYSAYKWNLNIDSHIDGKGTLLGAALYIDQIKNWNEPEEDRLYFDLLKIAVPSNSSVPNSVNSFYDDQATGDYFINATPDGWTDVERVGVFSYPNSMTTPINIGVGLSVATINRFRADNGWLGIGLDPDCHYYNERVRLVLNVPEPSSISLLLLGTLMLSGCAFIRRRRE